MFLLFGVYFGHAGQGSPGAGKVCQVEVILCIARARQGISDKDSLYLHPMQTVNNQSPVKERAEEVVFL